MSKLFNSLKTRETSPQASGLPLSTWQVKLSNGAVYGPIELGELRTWAEECRLAPGDQVSSDTGNWANAETLPELAMQWMVEMASGEIFGPVNLHAIIDFFHSRMVLPSSRLKNRVTGEVATVADLILPLIPDAARDEFPAEAPVAADNAASADRLIRFNRNTSTTRLPPDQHNEKLQLRIEQLQATEDESESRINQLQSDLDSKQAQTLKLRDEKAVLEKKYDLASQSEREIEMRQNKIERLNAALAEKEEHGANAARDWDSIRSEKESRIQTLTRQIEALTADQTAMRSALEQNRAEFEQARHEARKLATRTNKLNELATRTNELNELATRTNELNEHKPEKKPEKKTGKKVLVVNDNEVIQQLVTKLAEKHGASVTAVASARDVIGILAEKACRFDLFVIDLILADITGWEIIGILRSRPETKDTPILVLTGPLSSKEKEKLLQKANAVIEKNKFILADFNKVLNQWL